MTGRADVLAGIEVVEHDIFAVGSLAKHFGLPGVATGAAFLGDGVVDMVIAVGGACSAVTVRPERTLRTGSVGAAFDDFPKAPLEDAHVGVAELVLQPLAAADAVLTKAEREMGVAVVDIGGGTTDIGIFIDDAICHTVVVPTGGNHLTGDIAVGLRTPFHNAEQIKIQYGHAMPEELEEGYIEVVPFGAEGRHSYST